jgi:hypothetical protein
MDHHLPLPPAGHASLEPSAGIIELVVAIDRGTELTTVELGEL